MSDTAKQSPLGVNVLGSLLQNTGLGINKVLLGYIGESKYYIKSTTTEVDGGTYTFGSLCGNTVLNDITYAINSAYLNSNINVSTYNNLISIGANTIPALGNSKPPTYTWDVTKSLPDPDANIPAVGRWTVGYSWAPVGWGGTNQYTDSTNTAKNPVTAWGYLRLHALQAWGEFNYNDNLPNYNDFLYSFMAAHGFIEQSNSAIMTVQNSKTFLDGTYSNMNDLITGDIAGVSLSTLIFGNDLIALGKALDLRYIETFGLPSNLLKTLRQYNGITKALNLAILSSGIDIPTLSSIIEDKLIPSTDQEKSLYGAYSVIVGTDLEDILILLNCKTPGVETLADLLNPQKLFPNSYQTLTVPIYNTEPQPTNSKTYYPIYGDGGVNQTLQSSTVTEKVGSQIPSGTPPIAPPPPPPPIVEPASSNVANTNAQTTSRASGSSSGAYITRTSDNVNLDLILTNNNTSAL